MNRHAKASSAGSTQGQGNRPGSFLCGALVARCISSDANGSGALSIGTAPVRLLIAFCLSVAALFALWASSALAAQTHPYTGTSFGPDGVGGSESFERVQSIAVDPENGDTYVYDGDAGKIYKFDEAGAPVNFSATGTNAISGVGGGFGGAEYEIALAPAGSPGGTAGDIYIANASQAIHVYSAAGAELGEVEQGGETCGVATDPSGNFYTGIYPETINKFTPSANPPLEADKAGTGTVEQEICNVAADGLGNVYAASYSGGLYKLEGIGDGAPTLIDSAANTMAIAPASNDLYADRGNEVFLYDSSGTPIGSFGGGDISESHGVAVNSGATKIYVGTLTKVKVFGPSILIPDAITNPATNITDSGATLNGTINPEGIELEECAFEYRTGSGSFTKVPCAESPATIGSGNSPVAVHLDLSELVGGSEYQFHLIGKNEHGTNSGVDEFFTTDGPSVGSGSVSDVSETSATFHATVNPNGVETSYVFEYVTQAEFESSGFAGATSVPAGGEDIGAGTVDEEVSATAEGLAPGTPYRVRVAAISADGTTRGTAGTFATFGAAPVFGSCSNDRFRTGPSAKLPDCRAYEQATPKDKFGSEVSGTLYSVQASDSGDAVTSFTFAGFPGPESFQGINVLMSRFAAGAWSTAGLSNPYSYGDDDRTLAWTSDLRLSFGEARHTGGEPGYSLVMRDSATGSRTTLIPQGVGFDPGLNPFGLVGGALDNDSKVVFAANGNVPVTSGPAPLSTASNVYLYDHQTGELTLAGLLPNSACATPPCVPGNGSEFPLAFEGYAQDGHVVSSSGDIYFLDGSGKLYLRRDAAGPGATTVVVSASQKNNGGGPGGRDPDGPQPVEFAGATPSGSKALFMSKEELTNDASTGGDETQDLYVYSRETGGLADLAPGGEVIGVLGYSDAANRVYFAANGDLDGTGPAAAGNCEPGNSDRGSCSVYLWQADGTGGCATAGGCVSFVSLVEASFGDPNLNWLGGKAGGGVPIMKSSRVNSDGSTLVFSSKRKLTPFDNQSTPEFYRYDAGSGQISCLTCNPSGTPPIGEPDLKNGDLFHAPTSHIGYEAQPFLSRNLSPNGKRFFFQSPDKLVSTDVNGEVNCPRGADPDTGTSAGTYACSDVYEWEASGEGTCTEAGSAYSPTNGGCIYLLSTGTGPYPSYLADVSESGDVAFIYSRQQLVPRDEDFQEDLYAVKVDGGLAADHEARPALCEGDACRGASSQPSSAPGAGTAAFEGPGNPKQGANKTRCPKGKRTVHSKGKVRCVAKKHKKHRHKHKTHKHKRANDNRRASR